MGTHRLDYAEPDDRPPLLWRRMDLVIVGVVLGALSIAVAVLTMVVLS